MGGGEGSSMNTTGAVEQVGTKPVNTKYGTKNTYSAKVAGQWYQFGFKDPKLSVGEAVSFEYTPGKYGNEANATTITRGAAPTTTADPAPAPAVVRAAFGSKGAFPIPALDGQRAIVRQNAITNAREMYVASKGGKGFALDFQQDALNVIEIAKMFEAWACGDMDMEAAKASIEPEKKAA